MADRAARRLRHRLWLCRASWCRARPGTCRKANPRARETPGRDRDLTAVNVGTTATVDTLGAAHRTPTLLLTVAGHEPAAISAVLAQNNINAPAGSFYAHEASRRLGLGEPGGVQEGR